MLPRSPRRRRLPRPVPFVGAIPRPAPRRPGRRHGEPRSGDAARRPGRRHPEGSRRPGARGLPRLRQRRAGEGRRCRTRARDSASSTVRARSRPEARPTPRVPSCSAASPRGRGYTVEPGGDGRAPPRRPSACTAPDDRPDASLYEDQSLVPGFQYLQHARRDPARGERRAARAGRGRPVPDRRRVLRLRPCEPRWHAGRESARADPRVRDGRGQPPRHRLLRRFVALLRAAPGPRRLRRRRDGGRAAVGPPRQRSGMVGISYSGITQLDVAETRPPHLAAITPLSVIADTYRGVLYPGGILNTGFAVPWAEDRQSDAAPAPDGGQGWAKRRVAAGDTTCAANQALRLQTGDVLAEIRNDRFYDPRSARQLRARALRPPDPGPDVPRRRVAGRADRRAVAGDDRRLRTRGAVAGHDDQRDALGVVRSRRRSPAGRSSSTSTSPDASPASPLTSAPPPRSGTCDSPARPSICPPTGSRARRTSMPPSPGTRPTRRSGSSSTTARARPRPAPRSPGSKPTTTSGRSGRRSDRLLLRARRLTWHDEAGHRSRLRRVPVRATGDARHEPSVERGRLLLGPPRLRLEAAPRRTRRLLRHEAPRARCGGARTGQCRSVACVHGSRRGPRGRDQRGAA